MGWSRATLWAVNSVDVVSEQVRRAAGPAARIVGDGTFDDPENARIIYLAAGGLVLLAVLLGLGTWYWWRTSKVEHPALGPLEVMGTRGWRKADYNTRARELEAARPANAIHEAEPVADDELDLAAIATSEPVAFDDFSDLLPAEPVAEPVMAEPAAEVVAEPAAEVVAGSDPIELDTAVEDAPADEPAAVDEPAAGEPDSIELATAVEAAPADASPSRGIIVIDTSPSKPVAEQLSLDDAAADAADSDPEGDGSDDGDDADDSGDGDHFDPLLRLNAAD